MEEPFNPVVTTGKRSPQRLAKKKRKAAGAAFLPGIVDRN